MDSPSNVEGFDKFRTLQFFCKGLEATEAVGLPKDEKAHVASVLTTYTDLESLKKGWIIPPLNNLSEFYKCFGFYADLRGDLTTVMNASAQNLFLVGFFRDQMKRRYSVAHHDRLGQALYHRASKLSQRDAVRSLFTRMSENFPLWALACCQLQRLLLDNLPDPRLIRRE